MSGVCRRCGCTDARACIGGCWWATATADLCSRCEEQAARDARGSLLRRVLDRLPTRVQDWLAGVVVDVLWRAAAREKRRAQAQRPHTRRQAGQGRSDK